MNQKPCAKMPVVAQKTIYNARPPSKQIQTDLFIVKLFEELKTFFLVLILVLFFKLWIFLLVDTEN